MRGHVQDALTKGARATTGGPEPPSLGAPYDGGYFASPTVLADATIDMKIFREETFGPAIPLFRFGRDAEAVQMANDTEYGLAAYFYTTVRPCCETVHFPCASCLHVPSTCSSCLTVHCLLACYLKINARQCMNANTHPLLMLQLRCSLCLGITARIVSYLLSRTAQAMRRQHA